MAPKQDDLAARMDPSKIRARGFNTGKGAKASSALADDGSAWNETPEQKMKRLQDEMMGVTRPTAGSAGTNSGGANAANAAKAARDEVAAARIREHTVSLSSLLVLVLVLVLVSDPVSFYSRPRAKTNKRARWPQIALLRLTYPTQSADNQFHYRRKHGGRR